MKVNTLSAATLALLTQTVLGDFSIYASSLQNKVVPSIANGLQAYPLTDGVINCDQADDWIWQKKSDVSKHYGVRCAGDKGACTQGSSVSGAGIKQLEWNTGKDGRTNRRQSYFTYYADRGGAMVDLQGKVIGTCTPAPLQEFHCMIKVRSADGERKLDCKSDLTPADFTEPY